MDLARGWSTVASSSSSLASSSAFVDLWLGLVVVVGASLPVEMVDAVKPELLDFRADNSA